MNQLILSARLLLSLQIGPREAMALGVIERMGGTCKSIDLLNAFDATTKAPLAVAAQLRNKGLVTRHEPGFWALTEKGIQAIKEAKQ